MNTETANDPRSVLEEGEHLVARVWRLLALRGVVAIVFAIVLLVWPDIGSAMVTSWARSRSRAGSSRASPRTPCRAAQRRSTASGWG